MPQDASLLAQATAAAQTFEQRFGRRPTVAVAAPGRVNLIGEHTDYSDGFVLPMAIECYTVIVADRAVDTSSTRARIASTSQDEIAEFAVTPTLAPGSPKWANYVKGVVAHCLPRGLNPGGFDAVVDSTVPLGGGLSSSAALEVATATLIEALTGQQLDPVEKALICQKAEHTFAGVPCGIMDQFISTMGQEGHAMLLDCRSHEHRMVPLADPKVSVLIANTNVKHELTGGEYAQRRAQCEEASRILGVKVLRDVSMRKLVANRHKLDDLTYRRAFHVVGENARTVQAADEMTGRFWVVVGRLMYKSHASLAENFEVSTPELDLMVELARQMGVGGGVYGSRMTGGGFGGCTVSLVKTEKADAVAKFLFDNYTQRIGTEPTIFVTRPAQGARRINL